MEINELNKNARGGTELLMERLHQAFPDIHNDFQIIPSRVREIDPDRKTIYYVHDLPNDPEVQHLKDGGWKKFDKIVFVSHWQQQMYNIFLGVPYSAGTVILNSIIPNVSGIKEENDKVRLIYHSTPHRGLDILADTFPLLQKDFGEEIELNVISSFDLYGWESRDKPYEGLFKKLQDTENVHYSKSIPNEKLMDIMPSMDIFAYPSTWVETSCLCLIEAMASNLTCVHSSLGALPETSGGSTKMYQFTEDKEAHKMSLYRALRSAIAHKLDVWGLPEENAVQASMLHALRKHNWNIVKNDWEILFDKLS